MNSNENVRRASSKVCKQCSVEKELVFFRYRKPRNNYESYCKVCEAANSKKWAETNKERRREITLKKDLKRSFSLSLEDYYALVKKQHSKCAVCKAEKSLCGRRLAVDHCHRSKKVRGLLCNECNTALGLLKENEAIIDNLKAYLIRTRSAG